MRSLHFYCRQWTTFILLSSCFYVHNTTHYYTKNADIRTNKKNGNSLTKSHYVNVTLTKKNTHIYVMGIGMEFFFEINKLKCCGSSDPWHAIKLFRILIIHFLIVEYRMWSPKKYRINILKGDIVCFVVWNIFVVSNKFKGDAKLKKINIFTLSNLVWEIIFTDRFKFRLSLKKFFYLLLQQSSNIGFFLKVLVTQSSCSHCNFLELF